MYHFVDCLVLDFNQGDQYIVRGVGKSIKDAEVDLREKLDNIVVQECSVCRLGLAASLEDAKNGVSINV